MSAEAQWKSIEDARETDNGQAQIRPIHSESQTTCMDTKRYKLTMMRTNNNSCSERLQLAADQKKRQGTYLMMMKHVRRATKDEVGESHNPTR